MHIKGVGKLVIVRTRERRSGKRKAKHDLAQHISQGVGKGSQGEEDIKGEGNATSSAAYSVFAPLVCIC